jgi:hypothetical protein
MERGSRARALLDNALLRDAIAGLDRHYVEAWRRAGSVEAREDCHRYLKLVEKLVTDLTSIATTGDLEKKRLKELEGSKSWSWP